MLVLYFALYFYFKYIFQVSEAQVISVFDFFFFHGFQKGVVDGRAVSAVEIRKVPGFSLSGYSGVDPADDGRRDNDVHKIDLLPENRVAFLQKDLSEGFGFPFGTKLRGNFFFYRRKDTGSENALIKGSCSGKCSSGEAVTYRFGGCCSGEAVVSLSGKCSSGETSAALSGKCRFQSGYGAVRTG